MAEIGEMDRLYRAMQEFKRSFEPSNSVVHADERFTTREVYDKFLQLTCKRIISPGEFQELLEANGFKYRYFIDKFVWPMNYRVNDDPDEL